MEYRDYSYSEWVTLAPSERRELIEEYWNPHEPHLGEATRGAILEAFGAEHPHLLSGVAESHTAYFTNWGWCIAVMVLDSAVRVPRRFGEFRVVKGVTGNPGNPLESVQWLAR